MASVASEVVLVPSCAAASSLAKSLDELESADEVELPKDELELPPLTPSCESSSEPLCSDCSCCSIPLMRVRTSEIVPMLIEGLPRSSAAQSRA